MEMGKEIRQLRNERGLTQEALAVALHVSPQTVSKWEQGQTLPDVQLLPEIAVFFGVTVDRLFAMNPEQQMERIRNRIEDSGLLEAAEERQMVTQLRTIAEEPTNEGQAKTVLAVLYNHQAEQYRTLAVTCAKEAVEKTNGNSDAVSELANAWGSYIPDWNVRNHHALIEWFSDFCRRHPDNRSSLMWLLDNLIDDRRLTEASQWLDKLAIIDHTFRVPMYRYMIAQAFGEKDKCEELLHELTSMEEPDWCRALTLGDLYTLRQEYDTAIAWYRSAQEIQPSPKFTDMAMGIAHICEILGDRSGAIDAYREVLRLLRVDWGIVSGEEYRKVEREIQRLQKE